MNKFLKWLLTFIVGMLGSFITYQVYTISNEWSFTIAFLGGAVTMIIVALIHKD